MGNTERGRVMDGFTFTLNDVRGDRHGRCKLCCVGLDNLCVV